MKHFITITLFAFLLSACNQGKAVADKFHEIINPSESSSLLDVYDHLDQSSKTYLQELTQYISAKDIIGAEVLGMQYDIPLSTLIIYENLKPDSAHVVDVDKDQIIALLLLTGQGPFRHLGNQQLKLDGKPKIVAEGKALASVLVPTSGSNTFVQTTYEFNPENDDWQLSLPSTFSLQERVMAQNRTRRGMTNIDYAIQYANSAPENLEFSYRVGY